MPISTSEILADYIESSGGRFANVRLTDHVGKVVAATIRVALGADATVTLAAMIPQFEASIKQDELNANLVNAMSDDVPSPTFEWCTKLEFAAVLRETFRASGGRDAARLAWYVNSFGLTDAQLRNLFGLTVAQLPAFKTRMDTLANKYVDMQDEVGE